MCKKLNKYQIQDRSINRFTESDNLFCHLALFAIAACALVAECIYECFPQKLKRSI